MLVLVNPLCGDRSAPSFVEQHVLPLLRAHNRTHSLATTIAPRHAGQLAAEYASKASDPVIVVAGGDGTVHEVVNGLLDPNIHYSTPSPSAKLLILPLGTANALHASFFPTASHTTVQHKLQSLEAYLNQATRPIATTPLAVQSVTVVHRTSNQPVSPPMFSIVVVSTSLHASILQSADKLRADIAGIERFKVAAQQNISNWYHATVKLVPGEGDGGVIRKYDPSMQQFTASEPIPSLLQGPFEYFLSTVNVDRLEPEFQITPLRTKLPESHPYFLDIVLIRPCRHPKIGPQRDTTQLRELFVPTTVAVLQHAYKQGAHVDLRYDLDGSIISSADSNLSVVEYYRCGGWEWHPMDSDAPAKFFCADGTIVSIDDDCMVTCKLLSPQEQDVKILVVSSK